MILDLSIDLAGGAKMTVSMTVHEDPCIPAPLEPDVRREPSFPEFVEALGKLHTLNFEILKGGGR